MWVEELTPLTYTNPLKSKYFDVVSVVLVEEILEVLEVPNDYIFEKLYHPTGGVQYALLTTVLPITSEPITTLFPSAVTAAHLLLPALK